MNVLLVKLSSMGDVLHTLPAIADIKRHRPDVKLTWIVEEAFVEIAKLSPHVDHIIPVALRRWRKLLFSAKTRLEYKTFLQTLRETSFDCVIDAQGLLKSVFIAKKAQRKPGAPLVGFNTSNAREPIAALFYQQRFAIAKSTHAITRSRLLAANALNYEINNEPVDFGIDTNRLPTLPFTPQSPYLVFLHNTTWDTKHYPEDLWRELIAKCTTHTLYLPWYTDAEHERAKRLADGFSHVVILPKLNLFQCAKLLSGAHGVVALDTGLSHFASALQVNTVSLYGPTDPARVGGFGPNQIPLISSLNCAPCFKRKCLRKGEPSYGPICFYETTPNKITDALRSLHVNL